MNQIRDSLARGFWKCPTLRSAVERHVHRASQTGACSLGVALWYEMINEKSSTCRQPSYYPESRTRNDEVGLPAQHPSAIRTYRQRSAKYA
jgi:hypothetical protein